MNNTMLVETLRPLPRLGRVRLSAQVERLRKACGGDSELEAFQDEVLDVLMRMFGAAAAGFWFRPWGGAGIYPSVRTGFGDLEISTRVAAQLDQVVTAHWQTTRPVVHPLEEADALVLVAPLRDGQSPIGAIQLVVVSDSEAADADAQSATRASYARALGGILSMIQPALLKRMQVNSVPITQAEEGLVLLEQQIAGVQRTIRMAIERYVQQLSGATFGGLEENQRFTRSIQKLLDSHGLRVRCPECGHPAILRCSRNAAVRTGVFVFDHYLPEGRTFHGGGRSLPTIRLMAKPSRRKSSS